MCQGETTPFYDKAKTTRLQSSTPKKGLNSLCYYTKVVLLKSSFRFVVFWKLLNAMPRLMAWIKLVTEGQYMRIILRPNLNKFWFVYTCVHVNTFMDGLMHDL